jgi:putative addiction module killer protein
VYEIAHYLTADGRDLYQAWLERLRDRQAQARVMVRVERLRAGHFGDCKPLRAGVWELRVDCGPGYRIYYARAGRRLVLLLLGGDKRTQDADISRAVEYWQDFQRRNR